ncbi:MAG: flagellar basal body-associated FliL family protein, partial [Pseudomonas sp.]
MAKQPDTAEPAVVAPKKNKTKLVIVAVVALLLAVGLSVAATLFFLSGEKSESTSLASESVTTTKQQAIYEVLAPAFVVNFKSQGKPRYLQVSVALMARNKSELDQLKVHMPTLRNQLVMLFSNQDFDELNTA